MAPRQITKLIEETIEKMELQEHICFTPEEKIYFEENFEPFHLKKGHYLITKDELVEHFYYLEEGILNICFPDSCRKRSIPTHSERLNPSSFTAKLALKSA